MARIGIAVGRSTHTVVLLNDGKEVTQQFISNDQKGVAEVQKLLQEMGLNEIVFAGNHRWALPFASALTAKGTTCSYYSFKTGRGERGRIGSIATLLVNAFNSGIQPKPFFRPVAVQPEVQKEEEPYSYRVAREYLDAANQVRELKHHLLDCMAVLFPEAVKATTTKKRLKGGGMIQLPIPYPQPPDLFSKGMKKVLENPDLLFWERADGAPPVIKVLAAQSLARYLSPDFRERTLNDHKTFVAQYYEQVAIKEGKMAELQRIVADHCLREAFGEGKIMAVLIALLGWREWPHWRELRRFCGLDVSRLDGKGKPRISRVRPEIRMYLYLFVTRTKAGKLLTGDAKGRVKRIERGLKYLWWAGLKPPPHRIPVLA